MSVYPETEAETVSRKYMNWGMAVLASPLRGIGCTAGYRRKTIQKSL